MVTYRIFHPYPEKTILVIKKTLVRIVCIQKLKVG
jgi:hypothetical protein